MSALIPLLAAIAAGDRPGAVELLDATPSLATARLERRDEFFLAERLAQVYEGDTALHAAAFSYDSEMARKLVARGADVRARNRRGAEPLHAAVIGAPGSATWDPTRQGAVIRYLVGAGAALAQWTTGRGGTGSAEAKAEQRVIVELLERL